MSAARERGCRCSEEAFGGAAVRVVELDGAFGVGVRGRIHQHPAVGADAGVPLANGARDPGVVCRIRVRRLGYNRNEFAFGYLRVRGFVPLQRSLQHLNFQTFFGAPDALDDPAPDNRIPDISRGVLHNLRKRQIPVCLAAHIHGKRISATRKHRQQKSHPNEPP